MEELGIQAGGRSGSPTVGHLACTGIDEFIGEILTADINDMP